MATALRSRDLTGALALIGEAAEAQGLESFRACVLERLPGLVPSEITSYNEIEADGRFVLAMDPMDAWTLQRERDFLRLADQHPLIVHYRDTQDPRPAKISDFLTRRALRRTELYRSVYGPMGVEYQMALTLPAAAGAIVGIALNRDRHDFAERADPAGHAAPVPRAAARRDRRARARPGHGLPPRARGGRGRTRDRRGPPRRLGPFASSGAWGLLAGHLPPAGAPGRLPDALAAWIARRRRGLEPPAVFTADGPAGGLIGRWLPAAAPGDPDAVLLERESPFPSPATLAYLGLSRRQAEVLALVARGHTNGQVAQALGVSPRTVQKHLEHIFDRLGVRTRAAATARALGANAAA